MSSNGQRVIGPAGIGLSAVMVFRQRIALGFIIVGVLMRIGMHYFGGKLEERGLLALAMSSAILLLAGVVLVIPYKFIQRNYFFDNNEPQANGTRPKLVKRLRHRALLLHNFSAAVLGITVAVILGGLYLFITLVGDARGDANGDLIVRSASIVLLIFLVQVLFRVFKYLLRVGSFYHGIADVLELHAILGKEPGAAPPAKPADGAEAKAAPAQVDLDKLFERLVPSAYDISDVESEGILNSLKELIKK